MRTFGVASHVSRRRRMRKARLGLLLAILLLAGAAVAATLAYRAYTTPLPLPRTPFDFEVKSGASLASVARSLRDAGVVAHPALLTLLGRWRSVDRAIKAGSYEIEQGITLPQLLAKLTQGDVLQSALTIVEGTTFAELKRALRESDDVRHDVVELPDAELLARLGATEAAPEGLCFPDP